MLRRLYNFLAILSLLLGIAAGIVWWRSWHHAGRDEDRYSWITSRGDRCTVRSDAGQVTLFEPPAGNPNATAQLPLSVTNPTPRSGNLSDLFPPPYPDPTFQIHRLLSEGKRPSAQEAALALRNDQIDWMEALDLSSFADPKNFPSMIVWTDVGSAAFLFAEHDLTWGPNKSWFPGLKQIFPAFATNDAALVLLCALEDPQRFAAAHILLDSLTPQVKAMPSWHPMVDQVVTIDGLRIDIGKLSLDINDVRTLFDRSIHYDPAQIPAIRDQWHRRLDVAAASLPWWTLTLATALLPAMWIAQFARRKLVRRQRSLSGRCVACGYDLRSSPGECSECGASVGGVIR